MIKKIISDTTRFFNSCNKRKKYYIVLSIIAFVIIISLCFIQGRTNDYFHAKSDDPEYTSDFESSDSKNDFNNQLIAEGFEQTSNLYKGDYLFRAFHTVEGDGGKVVLIDTVTNNVIGESEILKDTESTEIHFTLNGKEPSLKVRVYQGNGSLTISTYTLDSLTPVYSDSIWGVILALFFFVMLLIGLIKLKNGSASCILLLALAGVCSLPFITSNLQFSHDISFHLGRIGGIANAIEAGQFPVRINSSFLYGAGYENSILYPELFLCPIALLCVTGASQLLAYKVFCIAITFLTAFVSYYSGKKFLNPNRMGLLFACFYVLCPYRLNELFIRADLGEALAMAFLPLLLLGIYNLLIADSKTGFIETVISMTCILQSHIISTMIAVSFGGLFLFIVILIHPMKLLKNVKRIINIILSVIATFLLNLWFLVPFLLYRNQPFCINSHENELSIADNYVYLWQVFMGDFSYGGDTTVKSNIQYTTTTNEMSFTIGIVLLICAVIFVYKLICNKKAFRDCRIKGVMCLSLGFIAVFLSSSFFPWNFFLENFDVINSTFGKFQFAWRFLSIAVLMLSVVAAIVMEYFIEQRNSAASSILALLLIIYAIIPASLYLSSNEVYLESNSSSIASSISPDYLILDRDITSALEWLQQGYGPSTDDDGQTTSFSRKGTTYSFSFINNDSSKSINFIVPVYYYEGLYSAVLNSDEVVDSSTTDLPITEDGHYQFIKITIPAGINEGTIYITYSEPFIFRICDIVSLLSLGFLVIIIILDLKKSTISIKPL